MSHIPAYYWKHWSASTIGLTVNTLAINGDVFYEWEEEQQGLRWIIPQHKCNLLCNAVAKEEICSILQAHRERELGWAPGKELPLLSVYLGRIGRGVGSRVESQRTVARDFKFISTGVGPIEALNESLLTWEILHWLAKRLIFRQIQKDMKDGEKR